MDQGSGVQQQQLPPEISIQLTPNDVASIVKAGVQEALGSIQASLDSQKKENEKVVLQVQSLKRARELKFRFTGNQAQFEFNVDAAENSE
jgi:hypothetical protein